MKSVLLNKFNGKLNEEEINQLMRIMLIEKMVNTIVEELVPLKQHYVKSNNLIETGL
jgi:hypothetical protein